MHPLKEQLEKEAKQAVMNEFKLENEYQVPRLKKITLNIGTSRTKANPALMEVMQETLQKISGQKPVMTKARKSIASFNVREGQVVGMKVTLRGQRMYDFLQKVIHITFPRVRDFQGVSPDSFDKAGKALTIGFKENIAFPEMRSDEIDKLHGLEMTLSFDAPDADDNKAKALLLLRTIGFPFRTEEQEREAKESAARIKAEKKARERARKAKAKMAQAASVATADEE